MKLSSFFSLIKKGPEKRVLISKFTPYLLLVPTIIYITALIGYPLAQGVILAFQDSHSHSLSLVNFEALVKDPHFWEALKFTFLLAGIIIPIQVSLAIAVSLLLYTRFKGSSLVLYVFIIPLTLSDVSAALMWYNILTGNGYLNKLLMALGLIEKPLHFFGYAYRHMELLAIILAEVWRATAIVFVILFAGLQMIGRDYIEAADVFGATTFQKLRHVILPMLKPSLQVALVTRTLFALQVFGTVWILAGRDVPILAGEAFYWQTQILNYNVASAYALVIGVISILLGWLYFKFLKPEYLAGGGL